MEKNQVDWAFAESLAFGTLLVQGIPVRLSGQDSARGTFSQRHIVWWDTESPSPRQHTPLKALGGKQAAFQVFDSPLSEYSVLGFEYGYSVVADSALTLWEAQFGDFASGAQVIIDNYISSAERKWRQKSGIVLLLPHASEGQGPDHSNAHPERFLQLCAQDNLRVCNATTPAQYFHLLRRQALDKSRKPLVVLSPKSLLRHPLVVSQIADLVTGSFLPVLDDVLHNENASRILLCSGKIYYELLAEREKIAATDTVIIRLEQLYPFPAKELQSIISRYPAARETFWVQEEHKNYGAWRFVAERFSSSMSGVKVDYRGRPEAASAATGKLKEYKEEQRTIVESAFKKGAIHEN
jgi:2-oxoglutarate dehydrogenase complex dehydrogenase (E1) component-like enzyme